MKTPSEINALIESRVLSEEELREAILEGKRKQYWAEKNKDNPQLKEPEINSRSVVDVTRENSKL